MKTQSFFDIRQQYLQIMAVATLLLVLSEPGTYLK